MGLSQAVGLNQCNKKPLVRSTEGRARGDDTTSGHAPGDYYDEKRHADTVANSSKRCQGCTDGVSAFETTISAAISAGRAEGQPQTAPVAAEPTSLAYFA